MCNTISSQVQVQYNIFTVQVQGNDPSGMITSEILVKMYVVVLCII